MNDIMKTIQALELLKILIFYWKELLKQLKETKEQKESFLEYY